MTTKIARTGRVTIDSQGIGFVGKYEQTVPGIGSWYAVTAAGTEAPREFRTRRDAVAYLEQVERDRVLAEIQAERAAQDAALAAEDAPVVTLPSIPAEATNLAVDHWQDNGETIVAIHDRTGHEEQDGIWGKFLGHVTLREDATEDDARAALLAAGWTERNSLSYALPHVSGTVTTWTR